MSQGKPEPYVPLPITPAEQSIWIGFAEAAADGMCMKWEYLGTPDMIVEERAAVIAKRATVLADKLLVEYRKRLTPDSPSA